MSGRGRSLRSIALVEAAFVILKELQPATVRAVCYRLFVAGLIESMSKLDTNRVGTQLVWARENNVIPWEWIVDDSRKVERVATWDNPRDIMDACVRSYRRNYWAEQRSRVEIWSEKATVRGTLAPVLDKYGVPFRVMKGFGSATAVKDAADDVQSEFKPFEILYVVDWDPSGLWMSDEALPDRLRRYGAEFFHLSRIAISDADVEDGTDVPSFPASDKTGDSRHAWFVDWYGDNCYELDALSPVVLRDRAEREVLKFLDLPAWEQAINIELAERQSMDIYLSGYEKHFEAGHEILGGRAMSAAALLVRLDGVRSTGHDRWIARCSAHDDKRPSLSIRETDDGKVLAYCFGGCSILAVASAVGISVADLFPARQARYETNRRIDKRRWVPPVAPLIVAFELDILLVHVLLGDIAAGRDIPAIDRASAKAAASRVWSALQGARHAI